MHKTTLHQNHLKNAHKKKVNKENTKTKIENRSEQMRVSI